MKPLAIFCHPCWAIYFYNASGYGDAYSIHRSKRIPKWLKFIFPQPLKGRMYCLGEVNFIQGMHDSGNAKNSVGLKPNAEWKKDAKAPSIPESKLSNNSPLKGNILFCNADVLPMIPEGALASFFHSALGFSPTLFLALPESCIPWTEFFPLTCSYARSFTCRNPIPNLMTICLNG